MTDVKHEAPATGAGEREEIARIIDPRGWQAKEQQDAIGAYSDYQVAESLDKADAIIALRARSSAPEAREGEAWRTTCEILIDIVEGIGGIQHGTWRDEKGMRLKDTPAWAAFYVAVRTAAPSADKLRIASAALAPFAALAPCDETCGVNMNDPLSKWLTIADLVGADQALAALKAEG